MKVHFRADRGSSLLELALIMPLLMLTLIASAELGRIAYAAMEVSNAARAAVAYGAQTVTTAQDTTGMEDAAKDEASNFAVGAIKFPQSPTVSCVCESIVTSTGVITPTAITTCSGSGSTAATQCPTSSTVGTINNIVQYVQVNTQVTVKTMFKYNWRGEGLPSTFTLNGYAKMRVEQD